MRRTLALIPLVLACACAKPLVARDGTLLFQEPGAHGAAIVTANGVEYHDTADVPERIVKRDPYEPWRAPVGFIVPANGRFTKTSQPTVLGTTGLAVSLRPSDTRVPSWGGEMLVRIDVIAPAAEGTARWGEDIAIVIDGRGPDTKALVETALAQLGERDRVVVYDSAGARLIVPLMPASHRSLVTAAIEHHLKEKPRVLRARTAAVQAALGATTKATYRRVLVLSEAGEGAREEAKQGLGDALVPFDVVDTTPATGGELELRQNVVRELVPPAGKPAFHDVILSFDATPSPSRVLEASGGEARWIPEGGQLALGDVRSGDARAEVVRVTVPAWQPGDAYLLHVTAHFADLSRDGEARSMTADLRCVYDADIERLAQSRHGDVIAYASALATLARLDAAFTGGSGAPKDLLPVAAMHARSLALLAHDMHDAAAADQAALLEALLATMN